MSWDGYIDNLIGQAGPSHADKACIIGVDGSQWTTAAHAKALKLAPQEITNISRCFKSRDFSSFQASGVHIDGTKYQFLRVEDDKTVMAKKKEKGAVTLQASKTAIVIAHCPEGGQQGNCNKGVAVIAEYLESLGM